MNKTETYFQVTLVRQGWSFPTTASITILEAAQLAGLQLPSSCRNGTCRTCLCQMESGVVDYIVEWPGLSLEEKAEGAILPCVAQARSDLVLNLLYANDERIA
ncbi:2Fe-2S iron-sulfur cluster-binding protein [Undibacterium sp. Jales W-56]|uniref:2Fe-2S iron-sulfur cluster-binding protein n=1 Tax=Undibacterium sp. Jales W-56 TaxID=2897325 RepID=UPI003977BCB2